ncbi:hypothetical protein VNO77_03516 [Canavalia gladiata]|uniref:Uncharacterized protein n=1 Tax=Canavalia gladiata TaxID=3824 RepID=A0AAN9MWV0_CANGL
MYQPQGTPIHSASPPYYRLEGLALCVSGIQLCVKDHWHHEDCAVSLKLDMNLLSRTKHIVWRPILVLDVLAVGVPFCFANKDFATVGNLGRITSSRTPKAFSHAQNNDSANGIQQVEPLGRFRCNQPNERNGLRRNRSIYRTRFMTPSKAEVVSNMI